LIYAHRDSDEAAPVPDEVSRPAVVSRSSRTEGVVSVPPVVDHLTSRGVTFEVIPHERAYTTIAEARALGIAGGEVVKTVVLDTASGHVLVAVPGYRRLDMKLVEEATGDRHARLATEGELARDFPEYELGSLPPLGSLLGAPVYVDPEVMTHDTVVFAAGRQTESVKMRTEDLFRDESVTVVAVTLQPEVPEDGGLLEGGHRV
jgi:prolyl-tRNA editing enzyme YbaK/EbsC (Cys-tRNA(Pro) deacylase)